MCNRFSKKTELIIKLFLKYLKLTQNIFIPINYMDRYHKKKKRHYLFWYLYEFQIDTN